MRVDLFEPGGKITSTLLRSPKLTTYHAFILGSSTNGNKKYSL